MTAAAEVHPHPHRSDARTAFFTFPTRASTDGRPIVDYIGSDDSEDRYGSIISPAGWETDAYMRSGSGPVLWAHQYDTPPVGKTIRLTKNAKALVFRVEFAVTQSEFAREIWQLVRDGFLPGVSVGFIPLATTPYKATTVPTNHAENVIYTRAELLELSVVPVGANRGALKKAYGSGRISDRTVNLANLGPFLRGESFNMPRISSVRPKPLGMDPDLYRAALAAGLTPETAQRAASILARRKR